MRAIASEIAPAPVRTHASIYTRLSCPRHLATPGPGLKTVCLPIRRLTNQAGAACGLLTTAVDSPGMCARAHRRCYSPSRATDARSSARRRGHAGVNPGGGQAMQLGDGTRQETKRWWHAHGVKCGRKGGDTGAGNRPHRSRHQSPARQRRPWVRGRAIRHRTKSPDEREQGTSARAPGTGTWCRAIHKGMEHAPAHTLWPTLVACTQPRARWYSRSAAQVQLASRGNMGGRQTCMA
jgi:hypothetical protein